MSEQKTQQIPPREPAVTPSIELNGTPSKEFWDQISAAVTRAESEHRTTWLVRHGERVGAIVPALVAVALEDGAVAELYAQIEGTYQRQLVELDNALPPAAEAGEEPQGAAGGDD